ncbi:NAD-glutamate dehydrogenase, partial [bacterium]|nr:NAD-glutamate dehydrogenase [bacterium]
GYDHKLYGITARGAWECVRRHFANIGIDGARETFTVVGIGDMSGDVFGNGMLESDNIKLLAAFNHRHIFLDPDPDPKTSFAERKRLFELPRSSWSDYDSALMSRGGGVFERSSREITITDEVRELLVLPDEVPSIMEGEELISHILRAPVDLLWNGGIGTYVKSAQESHADVNDGANDLVRINATELRARVVGEGGNLGLTQKARIEFAKRGGHIHTDAIDNSGGVDLSDHEVNLKILFQTLMAKEKITVSERNDLLKEIADEVVDEVLRHNFNHALALTVGVERSRRGIDYFQSLLNSLAKKGIVNREIENLPDNEELSERSRQQLGLWKPELAICLASVKRWVKEELEGSSLLEDSLLQQFLFSYFPKKIRERYQEEIVSHPLAKNIIGTQVTNELIDSLGVTFVHRMCVTHSTSAMNVMKSTLAADALMGARGIREEIRQLSREENSPATLQLLSDLHEALRNLTAWFIGYHSRSTLQSVVGYYREGYSELIQNIEECLLPGQRAEFENAYSEYLSRGLCEASARSFASFPFALLFMEILWATRRLDEDVLKVAKCFAEVSQLVSALDVLRIGCEINTNSRWEAELLFGVLKDIRRALSLVTCRVFQHQQSKTTTSVSRALRDSETIPAILSLIEDMQANEHSVTALAVVARYFSDLPKQIQNALSS